MAKGEAALLPLAESVADGSSVDWHAAESHATVDEQAVIRQLRVLASLAAIHREMPAQPGSAAARKGLAPAIGNWADLSLVERLGGGTFGEVYRAWDRNLEREVALKLLRLGEVSDDPHSSRIVREGRLLARVRHPNVISVHSVEIHENRVGLCMELVRGTTVEEVLQKRGPFSAREAALIGIDLCKALAAIHAAGLIHRDIKAQNVMREDGGRIVLMDLGTGREVQSTKLTLPDLAGTPLYLAPEIFDGAAASERTDLYSVGVLLYHLVTGSFPVPAATVDELRESHQRKRVIRLRDARADLPTAFVQVVDRTIARDPERRYATAGALEADLFEALGRMAGVRPVKGPTEPVVDGLRRLWRQAALAATVVAVLLAVALVWWSVGRGAPLRVDAGPIRSIAVLPLKNVSGDPSQEYFADGMTDELIGTLGRLAGLTVVSRTSIMQFKESTKLLPEIAQALHVDAVLEGSVLIPPHSEQNGPAASRPVRINARLIQAGTDLQLWSKTFESVLGDVLTLQSQVARAVADGIRVRLTGPEQQRLGLSAAAARPQDAETFDLYLKGRFYCNMRTREGLERSIAFFQQAIDRSPEYARAYAGLAEAHHLLGVYDFIPRALSQERARQMATRALQLDGTLAGAHATLGSIQEAEYEWDAAEQHFKLAIEFEPAYATAHHWYAAYLTARGRFPDALAEINQAVSLDPLSIAINTEYGAILLLARRYDEAIAQLQKALLLNSTVGRTHTTLADAYAHIGDYPRALEEAGRAAPLSADSAEVPAVVGYVHALAGRRDDALQIARDLAARFEHAEGETAGAVASIYAALGETDAAFTWLEQSRLRREGWVAYIQVDPKFDRLRQDSRYAKLLASLGFSR